MEMQVLHSPTTMSKILPNTLYLAFVKNMDRVPAELWWHMMLEMEYETLKKICLTNVLATRICDNPSFWSEKLHKDYGIKYTGVGSRARYATLERYRYMHPQVIYKISISLNKAKAADAHLILKLGQDPRHRLRKEISDKFMEQVSRMDSFNRAIYSYLERPEIIDLLLAFDGIGIMSTQNMIGNSAVLLQWLDTHPDSDLWTGIGNGNREIRERLINYISVHNNDPAKMVARLGWVVQDS